MAIPPEVAEPFAFKDLIWRTPDVAPIDVQRLFTPLANLNARSENEKAAPAGPRNGSKNTHHEKTDAGAPCTDDTAGATVKRDPHSILRAIGMHSEARCAARAVLTVLASHVNYHGSDAQACFPSQTTLAKLANVTIRTVQRALKRLVELGEIEILEKGTGHRSTRYRLTILNALSKMSPQRRQKRHPNLPPLKGGREQPRTRRSRITAQRPSLARRILMATTGSKPETAQRDPDGGGHGCTGFRPDTGTGGDTGRAEKWREMKPEDIASARSICPAERWEALKAKAKQEGIAEEGLEAEATRRWRADRILHKLPLDEGVKHAA